MYAYCVSKKSCRFYVVCNVYTMTIRHDFLDMSYLGGDPGLYELVLREADLGVEVQHGSNLGTEIHHPDPSKGKPDPDQILQ